MCIGVIRLVITAIFLMALLLRIPLSMARSRSHRLPHHRNLSRFRDAGTMTGDWGGTRSRMKEESGVELEFRFTEFAQGVVPAASTRAAVGNGKFQTIFKFDLGKLAGWEYWLAEVRTETRFGGPLLLGTGALNPVNTTAIVPTAAGNAFTISAVNVTKLFPIDLKKGNLFAVSVGRFNLLDLIEEDFFAGPGIERFLNIAQIGPLTVLRAGTAYHERCELCLHPRRRTVHYLFSSSIPMTTRWIPACRICLRTV